MKYQINPTEKASAYIQLYNQLKHDIVSGVHPYGAKLPSKRLLSEESGVSVITVEHAYSILCDEGYIEARQRSGYYVIYREDDFFNSAKSRQSVGLINQTPDDSLAAGLINHIPEVRQSAEAIKHFSGYGHPMEFVNQIAGSGHMKGFMESTADFKSSPGTKNNLHNVKLDFPFSVLSKTMRKVLLDYGETILIKSPNHGCMELRNAIASYLVRSNGITVKPEQIIIGSGAEYLYNLIVQLLGTNRIYAIENPSYDKIKQVYDACGVKYNMLKLGQDGIKTAELEHTNASVLHITPFNSYPSNITASASKRREYIRWAEKRNGFIVEDNYDSELTVSRKAEDALFSLTPEGRIIYLNTFSKTIAPSLRAGYMVLPENLLEQFEKRLGFYSCTVPVFEQYVLAQLINNGDFERHINRVRRARRKAQKQ